MDFQTCFNVIQGWLLTSGLPILVIIIVMALALNFKNVLIKKYFSTLIKFNGDIEFEKRLNTFHSTIKSILNILIFTIGIMMILGKLNINIGPILAAAGVVGIAVGFGAQRLVEDIISGFIILIEDQIRVGDVVEVAGKSGLVEKIDLKAVVLRDLSGNVHYIRNGQIGTITNMTKEYSYYVFDIGVAYHENVDEVIDVIKHLDEELRNDPDYKDIILEPIEVLGLDKFDDSAVIIKARTKTIPIKQWAVGREFNRRLKKKFDELGIEIPFPHRTLYIQNTADKSPIIS